MGDHHQTHGRGLGLPPPPPPPARQHPPHHHHHHQQQQHLDENTVRNVQQRFMCTVHEADRVLQSSAEAQAYLVYEAALTWITGLLDSLGPPARTQILAVINGPLQHCQHQCRLLHANMAAYLANWYRQMHDRRQQEMDLRFRAAAAAGGGGGGHSSGLNPGLNAGASGSGIGGGISVPPMVFGRYNGRVMPPAHGMMEPDTLTPPASDDVVAGESSGGSSSSGSSNCSTPQSPSSK